MKLHTKDEIMANQEREYYGIKHELIIVCW